MDDPQTLAEALRSDKADGWSAALQKEMEAMESNDVYEWAVLPKGRKAVTSKLLFTTKTHADGTLDKLKVRLVARGYSQVEGIDYEENLCTSTQVSIHEGVCGKCS